MWRPRRASARLLLRQTAQPISPQQVPLSHNSCCSRSCPRRMVTAGSHAIQRMCGSICPRYGTPPRCGQCGLTRTRTTVRMVLWSCRTATYQCVAYEGCSLSNSTTHDVKLLSNIEHSIWSLLLNSLRHPAPIGMPSGGSMRP